MPANRLVMDLALLILSKYRVILRPSSGGLLRFDRNIVRVAVVFVGLVFVSHLGVQLD